VHVTQGKKKVRSLFTLGDIIVMSHLQPSPTEATLDVEALVGLAAVQYALVAPNLLRDEVERLDNPQSQLLALLVLGHRDILDVADYPEVVDAVDAN
jgi:hypothetical protein